MGWIQLPKPLFSGSFSWSVRILSIGQHEIRNVRVLRRRPRKLSYFGWLTSWWVQNLTVPFTPVHGIDKRRIHVSPEVVTLRPTIKMKPEACSFYFDYGTHTDVGRVFRVNTFQLVILFERVIWFWKHIQRGIFLQCTNVKYLSQLCFVRRSVFPIFFFLNFFYTQGVDKTINVKSIYQGKVLYSLIANYGKT